MKKIKAVFQEKSGFQWLFLAVLTMGLGYGILRLGSPLFDPGTREWL